MPSEPRISVHDYIDARLDEQDDRIELRYKLREQRILIELRETRAWVLLLTAPAWADFINGFTGHTIAISAAVITATFGFIGIVFYRTRKPLKNDPS